MVSPATTETQEKFSKMQHNSMHSQKLLKQMKYKIIKQINKRCLELLEHRLFFYVWFSSSFSDKQHKCMLHIIIFRLLEYFFITQPA
jgi:hypothetical protein